MKVATGYIYYFLLTIMALTFSLLIFVFRPFRRLLHKVQTKYKHILENQIFTGFVYFSFAIVGIILIESVYSFLKIHKHLYSRNYGDIQSPILSDSMDWIIWICCVTMLDITDTVSRILFFRLRNIRSITCLREISC